MCNFDTINRLIGVTGGANSESYAYDSVGNRTSSHLSSSYTTGSFNRLTATNSAGYSYNPNGSMTGKTVGATSWTYGWDRENRMVSAGNGASSVSYAYDALGRRVSSSLDGSIIKYQYDGEDVIAEKPYDGQQTSYINGPGIDNKISYHQVTKNIFGFETPTAQDIFTDHLGTTVAVGSTERYTQHGYEAFGKPQNPPDTRYQFTGREFDSFSGLQYSRARFYDPQIGRFISEDPIGFGGGDVNLYGYVKNNSINRSDPLGLLDAGDAEALRRAAELAAKIAAGGGVAAGAGEVGAGLSALAPPVAAAAAGAAAIYGAYKAGEYAANHPLNPFVNGPLNPFGPPYNPFAGPPPITQGPNKQPKCEPLPPLKPFEWTPPFQFPIPSTGPLGPNSPPRDREKRNRCLEKCLSLLPSPTGDLQSSEFRKCYSECMRGQE